MKKILLLFVMIVCAFTFVGCGGASVQNEHKIEYQSGEKVNVVDRDCVAIYTKYTNDSSETAIPADYITVKAFQNGKEIPCIVPTGETTNGYIQCDASVQSGVTAEVVWLFELSDTSPVSVEFSDGQKYEVTISQ